MGGAPCDTNVGKVDDHTGKPPGESVEHPSHVPRGRPVRHTPSCMVEVHPASPGLLDREQERRVLAQLVVGGRSRQSQALVLRGEAGSGKTALLRHVPYAAEGCTIVWATGVESEMELPFA